MQVVDLIDIFILNFELLGCSMRQVPYPSPGEILKREFLEPLGISQGELAASTGLSEGDVQEIVLGRLEISADRDQRLSRFFGTSSGFWTGLQSDYDKSDC